MSAEKPEIGDVWGVRGPQNRVLFVSENAVRFLTIAHNKIHPMIIVWPKDFVKLLEQLDTNCINMDIGTPDYSVLAKKDSKFIKDPYRDYWNNGQCCQGLRNVFEEVTDERVL